MSHEVENDRLIDLDNSEAKNNSELPAPGEVEESLPPIDMTKQSAGAKSKIDDPDWEDYVSDNESNDSGWSAHPSIWYYLAPLIAIIPLVMLRISCDRALGIHTYRDDPGYILFGLGAVAVVMVIWYIKQRH